MGRVLRCLFFLLAATACGAYPFGANAAEAAAAKIVRVDGYPELRVAGRPFFVDGAAFFYERIPRDQWRADMLALRDLGINTLDVYAIWNWHELSDGAFDFDGHTNPRRALRGLLQMARELGFGVIVRPGPVIRNEWRNGGYPAWLLKRPEYGMPLHDLLEGRYPPTATLQNAHSDDAAAEWMRNSTHLRYARRWLERAMRVVADSGVTVIAVALDDDQGAYIDNQTWPAPHLAAYLSWLRSIVSRFTAAPTFINTYEMKVTASAPVWAMGDWYQSDAYSIGEHDRAQLEFSTGLLQTQNRGPVMLSEFQAGWLEQPGDVLPRAADPSNSLLAVHTLLGMGLHGLVNFPAQDTLYPAGWETPFANGFYAWDAALSVDRKLQPRAEPTRRIGGIVRAFGPLLAGTHVAADAGIAYMTSAYAPHALGRDAVGTIAARTMQAQEACSVASLACDLVDLRFAPGSVLRRYPALFVPDGAGTPSISEVVPAVRAALLAYRRHGGVVVTYVGDLSRGTIDAALQRAKHRRNVEGAPGATLLRSADGSGADFLVVTNYSPSQTADFSGVSVSSQAGGRLELPAFRLAPRDAAVVPINLPLRTFAPIFGRDDRLVSSTCPLSGIDATSYGADFHIEKLVLPCSAEFSVGGQSLRIDADAAPETIALSARGKVARVPSGQRPVQPKREIAQGQSLPVRDDLQLPAPLVVGVPENRVWAYRVDAYADGYAPVILQNDLVRLIVSPDAGGRAFVFEDLATERSCFTTVGAMRDDVAIQPPPSKTDRIAKYTHQFPAGTFNRSYVPNSIAVTDASAVLQLSYGAPDVVPHGARFERSITLPAHAPTFTVEERATFEGSDPQARAQRAVSISSLAVGNPRDMSTQVTLTPEPRTFAVGASMKVRSHALGFYDRVTGELATIAWRAGDIEEAALDDRPDSVVARMTLAPDHLARTTYSYERVPSLAEAQRRLSEIDAAAQTR